MVPAFSKLTGLLLLPSPRPEIVKRISLLAEVLIPIVPVFTVPAEASQEPNQPGPPIGSRHPDPLTLRAWRLAAGRAIPLTAAQAFDLACTDSARSQHTPPEPGAQYAAAFPITGQPP